MVRVERQVEWAGTSANPEGTASRHVLARSFYKQRLGALQGSARSSGGTAASSALDEGETDASWSSGLLSEAGSYRRVRPSAP
jgi:hypothetical protein